MRNFTSEDKKKLKEFDDAVQKWFNDFTQYIEQQNEKLEKQLQVLHERFKNQKEGKEGEGWLQVQEEENHNYLTRLRKSLKQWQDLRRRKPLHGRRHWGHHEKRRRRRPKFHRRGNRQNVSRIRCIILLNKWYGGIQNHAAWFSFSLNISKFHFLKISYRKKF